MILRYMDWVPESEASAMNYHEEAKKWMEIQGDTWGDVSSVTLSAITEFLANLDGYTLFEHLDGKECDI